MTVPNTGVLSKFWIGPQGTMPITNTAGVQLNILAENIAATRGIIDANALQGTRSHLNNECREGLVIVGGSFSAHPLTYDLARILTYWLGGTPSGTSYPLAETLPAMNVQKRVGNSGRVLSFDSVYGNVMTISGSRGQPLLFDGSVVGTTGESEASAAPSGVDRDRTTNQLVFHDLAITLGGSTYTVFEFSLTLNNALDVEMVNSRTATAVFPTDRIVTISHPIPEAGVTLATFSDVEVAVAATFSYNSQSLLLSLPAVRYTTQSPIIQGRGETRYALNGIGYRTSTTAELVVTLDSTP